MGGKERKGRKEKEKGIIGEKQRGEEKRSEEKRRKGGSVGKQEKEGKR